MKTKHIYTAAAALMLAACSQDNALTTLGDAADSRLVTFQVQTQPTQGETRAVAPAPEALPLTGQGRQLWLMPSVTPMDASALTRGTQINAVSALSSFGVSAYKHTAVPSGTTVNDYLANNHLKPDFFYNLEATKVEGTEQFQLSRDYYWPATDEVLSFYAYAPYSDGTTNTSIVPSAATDEGPLSITFKVNTDLKSQVDFITASSSSTAHTDAHSVPSVRLNFAHQLTGIRFVIGNQFPAGFIKSIALKGVYTEGVYTVGGGWTLDPLKKDNFTITYQDKANTETPGEAITAADETFLMIPHEFADDDAATIEVVFNDGSTDYTVSAPLAGTTWEAGKNVTYAITSNKLTTLQIASIDFPQTPAAASGMPATARAWQEGDVVGMYVVAADGTTIKHKNIPVTYDGSKWNINHETADGTIYRLKDETFYFYYPYSTATNNQPSGYPEACTAGADAETFFGGVISNFSVAADQSSLDAFLGSDLMVAKATDEGHVSTIKATMERQVGIAVISLASKTIPETITYLNNAKQSETGSYTIATSDQFSTNVPKANGNKFYYFTNVGTSTSFNSKTGEKYYWNAALDFNLGKNQSSEQTAQTDIEWDWTFSSSITWNYSYNTSNTYYTWTAPETGNYTMECWGAQGGGSSEKPGGKGAYTSGSMQINSNQSFYVYIGQAGENTETVGEDPNCTVVLYGTGLDENSDASKIYWYGYYPQRTIFNNGFQSYALSGQTSGEGKWIFAGGGATDIRVSSGNWNNTTSLNSRIMVAAGGGGAMHYHSNQEGVPAGAYEGYPGTVEGNDGAAPTGGTQTRGGKHGTGCHALYTSNPVSTNGYAGFGQTAYHRVCGSGGGGGWYCGGNGGHGGGTTSNGAGGSSYISGHTDCAAAHATYVFSNTQMIDGKGKKWTNAATSVQTTIPAHSGYKAGEGHTGNGYARITITRQ